MSKRSLLVVLGLAGVAVFAALPRSGGPSVLKLFEPYSEAAAEAARLQHRPVVILATADW